MSTGFSTTEQCCCDNICNAYMLHNAMYLMQSRADMLDRKISTMFDFSVDNSKCFGTSIVGDIAALSPLDCSDINLQPFSNVSTKIRYIPTTARGNYDHQLDATCGCYSVSEIMKRYSNFIGTNYLRGIEAMRRARLDAFKNALVDDVAEFDSDLMEKCPTDINSKRTVKAFGPAPYGDVFVIDARKGSGTTTLSERIMPALSEAKGRIENIYGRTGPFTVIAPIQVNNAISAAMAPYMTSLTKDTFFDNYFLLDGSGYWADPSGTYNFVSPGNEANFFSTPIPKLNDGTTPTGAANAIMMYVVAPGALGYRFQPVWNSVQKEQFDGFFKHVRVTEWAALQDVRRMNALHEDSSFMKYNGSVFSFMNDFLISVSPSTGYSRHGVYFRMESNFGIARIKPHSVVAIVLDKDVLYT